MGLSQSYNQSRGFGRLTLDKSCHFFILRLYRSDNLGYGLNGLNRVIFYVLF